MDTSHKLDEVTPQWARCGFCEYTTKEASDLKHNESMHHEIVHCSKCEYGALDRSLVDEHTERKHKSNENIATQEIFKCDVCENTFHKNSLFQFHICKPDIKFACKSCTFISLEATELLSHVQSYHVTQKPFSCSYCDFSTTEESCFKSHVATSHDDSAKCDIAEPSIYCFNCSMCDFTGNKSDIDKHVQAEHETTSTVEPFPCDG